MQKLKIDPEFKEEIDSLSQDEYQGLEASIKAEGCRNPIIIWQGENIIVDGHNRYEICTRHGISFDVHEMEFDCREAVIVWMWENQLARRNLPEPIRLDAAINKLKPAIAALNEARRNAQLKQGNASPVLPLMTEREHTRKSMANTTGVSTGKYYQAETVLTKAPDYVRQSYKDRKVTAHGGYQLHKKLEVAHEDVQQDVARHEITDYQSIPVFIGLHKNKRDLYEKIMTTGVVHGAVKVADGVKAVEKAIKALKTAEKEAKRQADADKAETLTLPERVQLLHGNFAEHMAAMEANSVDWIITDPPYKKEFLPLYDPLAFHAERVLKPGGSLLVMVGQYYLPRVISDLHMHLNYHWTLAYMTPGGQSPAVNARNINPSWKPVLWLTKGQYLGRWIGDVAKSDVNDNDKRHHDWGQSESGMASLMEKFVSPGNLVLDPFVGGGTTGVVALALGCSFIGIDSDEIILKATHTRFAA